MLRLWHRLRFRLRFHPRGVCCRLGRDLLDAAGRDVDQMALEGENLGNHGVQELQGAVGLCVCAQIGSARGPQPFLLGRKKEKREREKREKSLQRNQTLTVICSIWTAGDAVGGGKVGRGGEAAEPAPRAAA